MTVDMSQSLGVDGTEMLPGNGFSRKKSGK